MDSAPFTKLACLGIAFPASGRLPRVAPNNSSPFTKLACMGADPGAVDWERGTVRGKAPLADRVASIKNEWNRTATASELAAALRASLVRGAQLAEKASTLTNNILSDTKSHADIRALEALNEETLKGYLKFKEEPPSRTYSPASPEHVLAVGLLTQQVQWVGNLVAKEITARGDLRNLPSNVVDYAAQQAKRAASKAGLPSWAIPAVAVALGGMLVLNVINTTRALTGSR